MGKRDVLSAERQAMFEPGKIENCLGTVLADAASDNPSRLLKFAEIILRTGQDIPLGRTAEPRQMGFRNGRFS